MSIQKKHRRVAAALAALLLIVTLIAPMSASAATKDSVKLLMVTEEGARLRKGPSSEYEVLVSLEKGDRVFYLGKTEASFAYVCSERGVRGYVFQAFLNEEGEVDAKQVYRCTARSAKVYKKASSHSSRVAKLKEDQLVIVYAAKGKWAYVATLDGKLGFVKKSALAKAH